MASRSKLAARKPRPLRPSEAAPKPPSTNPLAEWVARAGLGEEVRDALVKWLARQIVGDQFAKLEQGGYQEGGIPLGKVFVDLPISDHPVHDTQPHGQRRLFLKTLFTMKPEPLRGPLEPFGPESTSSRRRHPARAQSQRGFLVIGGPGQGKSTLGQLACQVHRAALLAPFVDQFSPAQRDVVRSFSRNKALRNVQGPKAPLFPVRIVLPEAAAWLANQERVKGSGPPILLRWLSAQAEARPMLLSPEVLHRLLMQTPFLLVLDGLDEVGAAEDRSSLVTSIRDLLGSFREREGRGVVVATTRPQGYTGEFNRIEVPLSTVYLAPLRREEALAYGEKLADAKFADQPEDHARVMDGLEEAAREQTTARLLSTPLQVTILAVLAHQMGRPPSDRWGLFENYFDTIYKRELQRGTYAAPLLRQHKVVIQEIHRRIGLLLQVEAEQAGGTESRVTRERLEVVTDAVLLEDGTDDETRPDLVGRIVRAAEQRLVFLVEPEPGKFGFEIRSLQEFMAAWALGRADNAVIEARLLQIAKAPMFRGVTLFLVSKLFNDRSPLRDILEGTICKSLDESESDLASKSTRAGALLALEILAEGSSVIPPKYERQLFERACRLLDLAPSALHIRLVWASTRNTGKVLNGALESRLSKKATEVDALGAWVALIEAASMRIPWAEELGKSLLINASDLAVILDAYNHIVDRVRYPGVGMTAWLAERIEEQPQKVLPKNLKYWGPFTDIERIPGWPQTMLALSGNSLLSVRYTSDGAARWHSLMPSGKLSWSSLASMQTPPVRWQPWVAVAKFAESPSALTLAESLRSLAGLPPMHDCWDDLAEVAPWPLSACLRSAESRDVLIAYSELAASGGLGDLDQWKDAEQQWQDRVTVRSLFSTTQRIPWAPEELPSSPPVGALIASAGTELEVRDLPNARHLEAMPSPLRQHLAKQIVVLLEGIDLNDAFQDYIVLADIKAWTELAGEIPAALLWTSSRDVQSTVLPDAWLKWIDLVGTERKLTVTMDVFDPPPSFIEWLLEVYRDRPEHEGILYWLRSIAINAFLSPEQILGELRQDVVRAFAEREVTHADLRIDAYLLRLWLGVLSADKATQALDAIVERAMTERSLWSQLVHVLEQGALPPELRESLLLDVYRRPALPWSDASDVVDALRRSLQSRRTGLSDPDTWKRLDLPLPLPQLFAQAHPSFTLPDNPVVITRLAVQQVRGLADITLELAPPPAPDQGQWTIILGPNGAGKTTLLRAAALALRNLADPKIWPKGTFATPWRAHGAAQSKIAIEIAGGKKFEVIITKNGSEAFARVPNGHPTPFPVFAYGCRRGSALGGAARAVDMKEDDGPEIATLFDEGAPLVHAETWLKEWQGAAATDPQKNGAVYETVIKALQELLGVKEVIVRDRQVFVTGPSVGNDIPFAALSDGYLTTAGWFLDLVARWIELATKHRGALGDGILGRMTGIVLLDEIDLHLHPRWQIEVIPRIKKLLPKMSFIVTTHNPLTLVGARPEEIWVLSTEDGLVRAERGTEAPMLLTGGQIYSRYFGIHDIYPNELGEALRRYGFLSGDPMRTEAEQVEMEGLRAKLQAQGIEPGWEETPRETPPKPRKAAPKATKAKGAVPKPATPKRAARTKAAPR